MSKSLLEDHDLETLDKVEFKNITYNVYSCLKVNNKKIDYFEYIKSGNNISVIKRISKFIVEIEGISKTRKAFYKKVLNERYNILEEIIC